ncbi:hypothetical protein AMTRI_Chr11g97700 [Amborella trichopoda]
MNLCAPSPPLFNHSCNPKNHRTKNPNFKIHPNFSLFKKSPIKAPPHKSQALKGPLSACTIMVYNHGMATHALIIKILLTPSRNILKKLLFFYCKMGFLSYAHKLFDELADKDSRVCCILINGQARHGGELKALHLFSNILASSIEANSFSLALIHWCVIKMAANYDACVNSALIVFYRKCGLISESRRIFYEILERDTMSWIVMIACYAERTYVNEAWELMVEMQLQGVDPPPIQKKMNCQGIRKEAGCSWIEIESEIHEFVAGDRSHPRIVKIKSLLKGLDSSLTSFIQEEHKSIKVENFKLK